MARSTKLRISCAVSGICDCPWSSCSESLEAIAGGHTEHSVIPAARMASKPKPTCTRCRILVQPGAGPRGLVFPSGWVSSVIISPERQEANGYSSRLAKGRNMVWAAFLRAGHRFCTYDDSHVKSGRPAFCEGDSEELSSKRFSTKACEMAVKTTIGAWRCYTSNGGGWK